MDPNVRATLESRLNSAGFSYGRGRRFWRDKVNPDEMQVSIEVERNKHERQYVDVVAEFTASQRGIERSWRFSQARSMSIRGGFYKLDPASTQKALDEILLGLERGTLLAVQELRDPSQLSWILLGEHLAPGLPNYLHEIDRAVVAMEWADLSPDPAEVERAVASLLREQAKFPENGDVGFTWRMLGLPGELFDQSSENKD